MKKIICLLILLTTFGFARAQIIDSVSLDTGVGEKSTINKVGVQHDWCADCTILTDHNMTTYVEFSVAQIEEKQYQGVLNWSHTLTDFGFTPAIRWYGESLRGAYLEVGVGANYMTDYYENRGRIGSTKYEFGDHLSLGYQFSRHIDLSIKFQHYSNADIKEPNPGINFLMLKLTCRF